MARIVSISKYPPLEGGIAAKTFWLAKAFGERGHDVHIVTDRLDIDPLHSSKDDCAVPLPSPLRVHRPAGEIPWHIPNERHRSLDLLNRIIEVIEHFDIEVIDSGYLIPYGLVAYLASKATGIPFILRHGGSDIAKFLQTGTWSALFREAFDCAALVATDTRHIDFITRLTSRSYVLPPYVPDPSVFTQEPRSPSDAPAVALIGKANYFWRHKGWDKAVDLMAKLQPRFKCQVIAQGIGLEDFKRYADERIGDSKIEWRPFVHPSRMPDLLHSVDAVFHLENDLVFPSFSNLVVEALYCGSSVITDSSQLAPSLQPCGITAEIAERKIIVIREDDAVDRIERLFSGTSVYDRAPTPDPASYQDYLEKNERLLMSTIRRNR